MTTRPSTHGAMPGCLRSQAIVRQLHLAEDADDPTDSRWLDQFRKTLDMIKRSTRCNNRMAWLTKAVQTQMDVSHVV